MLDTIQGMSLLTIMEIAGPILLAAGLIYGLYSRRRRGQQQQADTATRRLYTQEEARRPD